MIFFAYSDVVVISSTLLLFFLVMFVILWINWWMQGRKRTLSPYTGLPLQKATQLSYSSQVNIIHFMNAFSEYDNRMFKLRRAAFCRETGRIFPNAVTWIGEIKMNWGFLQKRFPGNWVSWGSLNIDQQEDIIDSHETLEGFQTQFSCPIPAPRLIEDKYSYTKPGPLYVDIETKILLGWQCVPGTGLEVLVVRKPKKMKQGMN